MEHIWKVNKLYAEQDYPTKTVCKVELKCTSTGSGKEYVGHYTFDIPNSGEDFIAFPELDEATVIQWCGDLSTKETENAAKLQELIDAPVEYALPWIAFGTYTT